MNARTLLREFVPPICVRLARRIAKQKDLVEWEFFPGGFDAANAEVRGWNNDSVLGSYLKRFEIERDKARNGAPFGLENAHQATSDALVVSSNVAMIFGAVLGIVARNQRRLSVLDWGGALGHYLLWAKTLRPDLEFDYTIKEMPLFLEAGRALWRGEQVSFDDGSSCLSRSYDLSIAVCSLHYSPDWRGDLQRLIQSSRRWVFINRLPLCLSGVSYTFVQRPYSYGYRTEYVGWCLSRDEFLEATCDCGLKLQREFVGGERPPIAQAPFPCEYRGFLFQL